MVELKDFPISLLLTGLFLISIVAFSIGIGHNYGQSDVIMKTEYINTALIESKINETSTTATGFSNAFLSDNPFVSAGVILVSSIWGITVGTFRIIISLFVIYFDIVNNVLGIPPIVNGVLLAVITITLIFLSWKVIKQGQ